MTARILAIELRRSNAYWLVPLWLPLQIAGVATSGLAAAGTTAVAVGLRQILLVLLPLILAVGAWQAGRDRRSRMTELLASTPRPRRSRVLPSAGALAIVTLAGYWLVPGGATAAAGALGGHVSAAGLMVGTVGGLFALVAAWLGLAVGSRVPYPLAPPALATLLLAGLYLQSQAFDDTGAAIHSSLLLTGGLARPQGVPLEFVAYAPEMHLLQGSWAAVLALAALLFYAASTWWARAWALVPLALGLAGVLAVLPPGSYVGVHLDPAAVATVCTEDTPFVCVTQAHRTALEGLREPGRAALAVLTARLPDPPVTVMETHPDLAGGDGLPRRADHLQFELLEEDGRRPEPQELPWALLLGAGTPACPDVPAEQRGGPYDVARLAAAAWLLDRDPPGRAELDRAALPRREDTAAALAALRALPEDEQRARVAALRRAELACDGSDRLALLVGP